MSKYEIVNKASRVMHRAGFQLKKHSPEILVVAGVAGTIASAVMACKATTKLSTITEEHKKQVEEIHNYVEENGFTEKYTEEDSKKDLTIVHVQSAVKVAKLYGPSVVLGAVSIAAILGGHNILRKRNLALGAAYATLDKTFKDYRSRVVDRFGEELVKELRYNIKKKEIEETVVNEDGSEATVNKTVDVTDMTMYSDYAKFFDDGCKGWTKDPEYNLMFLKAQQRYANDLLKTKGHLFLNEVYDMLGIDRTKAGQIVGWIYDEKHPVGDNYVDFGIYNIYSEANRRFVNGVERTILLDFNVDGDILNMI